MGQFEKDFNASIPPILYKYRDWNMNFHQRILTHGEIYFSSADQLNDPYDCTLPLRMNPKQLTEENIILKYIQMGKKMHPEWDDAKLNEEAIKEAKVGRFHDPDHLKWVEETEHEQMNKFLGIFCVSSLYDNFLMWSHYTNSHMGFCVGFDSKLLFLASQASTGEVAYSDDIPYYDMFANPLQNFLLATSVKSKIWEYEAEYRLTKGNFARKLITLPPEVIKEIYLGVRMPSAIKDELINVVKAKYPHAKIFEMQLDKNVFKLNPIQIF